MGLTWVVSIAHHRHEGDLGVVSLVCVKVDFEAVVGVVIACVLVPVERIAPDWRCAVSTFLVSAVPDVARDCVQHGCELSPLNIADSDA